MMAMRDLAQFHEQPAVVAWWQARMGRGLVWLAVPQRRRWILALASLVIGVVTAAGTMRRNPSAPVPREGLGLVLVVLATFGVLWLVYQAARHFARLPAPVRRHPQWALHGSYWALLALLWCTTPAAGPWRAVLLGLAILYPVLIWRMAYMLQSGQHGRMAGTGPQDHLMYLWPAYGGSDTPYGKGLAYLSQQEARTPEALARSQLAGIKLLLLAVVWRLVLSGYDGFVYGNGNDLTARAGLTGPLFPDLSLLLSRGAAAPRLQAWVAVYGELFEHVLHLAVKGHLIVGFLRLYGFHVFRNTYKPLLAESVVEFWNRYFYYFKELLSTFFFMPTFTGIGRRLQRWPRLRLFAAVFAAAFVGNVYYHLMRESVPVALGQVWQVLEMQRSRLFYCLLLAFGIFVSMLREPARRGAAVAPGGGRRVLRILLVWTFFGLITIWNTDGGAPFLSRVDFFLGLFGLGRS